MHPFKTIDTLQITEEDPSWLAWEIIGLATITSLFFSSMLCLILTWDIELTGMFFFFSIPPAGLLAAAFTLLTAIEAKGLQIIGKSRGFRITSGTAWAIVGHGSVGWFVVGLSIAFGTMTWAVEFHFESKDNYSFAGQVRQLGNLVMYPGALAGFLFFETFAYLGLRRCKYANRLRPVVSEDHND